MVYFIFLIGLLNIFKDKKHNFDNNLKFDTGITFI